MRGSTLIATVANLAVALVTYGYYGWNVIGGAVAARNTARLSSACFATALAAHFHRRFGRDYVPWIKAFVAAHVVHFGTVIAYHVILGKITNPMFWGVSSTGAVLLAATALTITKMPRTHLGLTYVVWLAFMVAFTSNLMQRLIPEGPLVALLVLAMVVHLMNVRPGNASTSAASA